MNTAAPYLMLGLVLVVSTFMIWSPVKLFNFLSFYRKNHNSLPRWVPLTYRIIGTVVAAGSVGEIIRMIVSGYSAS